MLGFSLFLGGGTTQGLHSDALIQVVSLGLIGLLLFQSEPLPAHAYWPAAILVALGLFIVLQLVWLPPAIWTQLPGRESITAAYVAAGINLPWLPLSLDPTGTWRAALSLIPPVALFFAVLNLRWRSRRSLSLFCLAFGLLSVVVGLGQLTGGAASGLYFFAITNVGNSVGFFANRNHYAALLYSLIPITAAWVIAFLGQSHVRLLWTVSFLLLGTIFLLGLGMSQSRAGLGLGLIAAIASVLLTTGQGRRTRKLALASLAVMLVGSTVLVIYFGLGGILSRLDTGIAADYRIVFARITAQAARVFQPVGSGFGTFPSVYQMFEQPTDLLDVFVNHAHDDWLEIWLEGGWPALALAAAFLVWLLRTTWGLWRDPTKGRHGIDYALGRAATIIVALLLVHSFVDYPLRTTACMSILAFACALMIEPRQSDSDSRPDLRLLPSPEPG